MLATILDEGNGWWRLIPPLDQPDNPSWYPSPALAYCQCRIRGWATDQDADVPVPEEQPEPEGAAA